MLMKRLGITIEQCLTFSEAIETRLYGMRSLKRFGLNKDATPLAYVEL